VVQLVQVEQVLQRVLGLVQELHQLLFALLQLL
jgi:hypothetical protein